MLPLTFDEVASLLLTWPRVGERPRFMSWHDSNTIIRSWHGASLSDGERAERRVGAGGLRAGWRLRRHSMTDGHITCTQAGKHRGTHTHMDISTNIYNHASEHPHTHTNQITVEVDRRRKTSSWIQLLLIFNLTMTSVMCFNCLNHFNDIVVAMDRYRIHD